MIDEEYENRYWDDDDFLDDDEDDFLDEIDRSMEAYKLKLEDEEIFKCKHNMQ